MISLAWISGYKMPAKLILPEFEIVHEWIAESRSTSRSIAGKYGCSADTISNIIKKYVNQAERLTVKAHKMSIGATSRIDTKTEKWSEMMRYASAQVSEAGRKKAIAALKRGAVISADKRRGVKLSVAFRERMSRARLGMHAGSKHPNWRGGTAKVCWRGANWIAIKRLIRKRDGNTCQSCGRNSNQQGRAMDVHHRMSFFLFSDPAEANQLENLICLCRSCHRKVENGTVACP